MCMSVECRVSVEFPAQLLLLVLEWEADLLRLQAKVVNKH